MLSNGIVTRSLVHLGASQCSSLFVYDACMTEDLISRKNALNLARDQILVDYATRLVESDVTIFQVTI